VDRTRAPPFRPLKREGERLNESQEAGWYSVPSIARLPPPPPDRLPGFPVVVSPWCECEMLPTSETCHEIYSSGLSSTPLLFNPMLRLRQSSRLPHGDHRSGAIYGWRMRKGGRDGG
jgi:hypothetical protein